jgi:RNA polymerase sigma factor for flagellar operon FliA
MQSQDPDLEWVVRKHAGLVRKVVNQVVTRYSKLPGGYEREDLEGFGLIGLIDAARTYDANRGVQFSTYAYKCIQNAILGALDKARTNQIDCVSFNETYGEDDDSELMDRIADKNVVDAEDAVIHGADRERLLGAIDQLDPQSATIVKSVYYLDMPLSEVARKLRLSPHRVQLQHAKALKKLRRCLHAERW